ncbi:MAG: DUF2284 domain-containing protein [Candidatus Limivivens sp.]|nr:DUF2284 domain-containing protein [Candidatus Limivivens sp.]
MSLTTEEMIRAAKEAGFSAAVPLDIHTLHPLDEVRAMCASNHCHMYEKNWSCPPGCGSLEFCSEQIRRCTRGILVQTIGDIEDSMDFEGMMEVENRHKEIFARVTDLFRKEMSVLPLGAGSCVRCKSCTYPDQPCRFPEKMTHSMEAYGLLVNQVCRDNQLPYYYGSEKIAYTSCYLVEEL